MTQETRPQNRLTAMARPKLLLRAARTYAKTCRRGETGPDTAQKRPADRALEALIAMEHTLETARRQRSPGYRSVRHVEVLAALLNARANQTKASGSPAFRSAMNACSASSMAGSSAGA